MEHRALVLRRSRLIRSLLVAATLAVTAAFPVMTLAGSSSTATVQFGNPNAPSTDQNCFQGSATAPPELCANAFHKLIPGAVAITAPGTVDFHSNGFHQVAVYNPGTNPNDIHILGGSRVNDPTNRFFLGTAGTGGDVNVTFTQPGKYLVICNITTHFEQNMWGWVQVQ